MGKVLRGQCDRQAIYDRPEEIFAPPEWRKALLVFFFDDDEQWPFFLLRFSSIWATAGQSVGPKKSWCWANASEQEQCTLLSVPGC